MAKLCKMDLLKQMLTSRTCLFPSIDPDNGDFCMVVVTNNSCFAKNVTNCKSANVANSVRGTDGEPPSNVPELSFSLIDYSQSIKYDLEKRLINVVYLLFEAAFLVCKHGFEKEWAYLLNHEESILNLPDLKVNLLSRTERYHYTYLSAMHDKSHSWQSQLNWMMNDIVSLFTTNFNVNLITDHTQFLEKWLRCDNPCYNVEYINQIVKTAVPTASAKFLNFFVGQSTLVVDEILRLMGDDFLTCNVNEWKPVMSTVVGF